MFRHGVPGEKLGNMICPFASPATGPMKPATSGIIKSFRTNKRLIMSLLTNDLWNAFAEKSVLTPASRQIALLEQAAKAEA
jgi:hypothetical protein